MRHRIVGRQAAFATTTRPSPRCLIAPIVRAATAPSPPTGGESRLCAKGRTSVGSASLPLANELDEKTKFPIGATYQLLRACSHPTRRAEWKARTLKLRTMRVFRKCPCRCHTAPPGSVVHVVPCCDQNRAASKKSTKATKKKQAACEEVARGHRALAF